MVRKTWVCADGAIAAVIIGGIKAAFLKPRIAQGAAHKYQRSAFQFCTQRSVQRAQSGADYAVTLSLITHLRARQKETC